MIESEVGEWILQTDYQNAIDCLKAWFSLDSVSFPADEIQKIEKYREALINFRDFLKNQKEECFGYNRINAKTPGYYINIPIRNEIIKEIERVLS